MDRVNICRRAFDAGLSKMRPGVPAQEVDRAMRKVMTDAASVTCSATKPAIRWGRRFRQLERGADFPASRR